MIIFIIYVKILIVSKQKWHFIFALYRVYKHTVLNRKFQYKRQLAQPRCHSFVNQQRMRL